MPPDRAHETSDASPLPRIPAGWELALRAYGPDGTHTVRLPRDSALTVGRDASCQLVVDGPTVSRLHARFQRSRDVVTVEDLGSRHGTWVAGERVQRVELSLDVAVSLSNTVVRLTRVAEPPADGALYTSAAMREVRELVHRAARTELPVVLLGETGTGKELAARELHSASARARGPLQVLNCAAIPAHLIESTLFGHERGAFTGAERMRPGILEDARGGTVFLDELGELSLPAQAALLRAIETRRITRVGATRELALDVRFVCATHRDLRAMVHEGSFRADLLHRLCVIEVALPPLRARTDEVCPLALHFLRAAQGVREIDARALAMLEAYDWPGNVRELRNVVERAAALSRGPLITTSDLPERIRTPHTASLPVQLQALEHAEVERALAACGGNQRRAALMLGLSLRTFERRLQALRAQRAGSTLRSSAAATPAP